MNNSKTKIIGHHGTTKSAGTIIVKKKSFNMSISEKEWLGVGVYFFEDDCEQAVDFCCRARKYEEWIVLKCEIETDNLLNLIDKKTYKLFTKFAEKLKGSYLNLKDGSPRELMNSVILNTMYILNPYDVVKAAFETRNSAKAPRTNINPMQIQLSVRNRQCICIDSIEEVYNYEC